MTSSNSGDECVICLHKTKFQKFLSCGKSDERHKLCLACIQNIAEEQFNPRMGRNQKVVACPFCREKTVLPDGDAGALQTKFLAELVCDDCCRSKIVEDQWWCKNCEKTTCGTCAMKKHRNHNCNLWEKYDVPKECLAFLKNLSRQQERTNELKQQIKTFCRNLEADLLSKAEKKENYSFLVENIEKAFGNLTLGRIKRNQNVTNLEKKLNVVASLMKSANNFSEVDANKIVANVQEDQFHMKIPLLADVIQMFDKNKSPSTKFEIDSVKAEDGYSTDSELNQEDGDFEWGPTFDQRGLGYFDRIVAWDTMAIESDSAMDRTDDGASALVSMNRFEGGRGGFRDSNVGFRSRNGGGGFGGGGSEFESGGGFGRDGANSDHSENGGGFGSHTESVGISNEGGFGTASGCQQRSYGGIGRGRLLGRPAQGQDNFNATLEAAPRTDTRSAYHNRSLRIVSSQPLHAGVTFGGN